VRQSLASASGRRGAARQCIQTHPEEFEVQASDDWRLDVRYWPLLLLLGACAQVTDDSVNPPPAGSAGAANSALAIPGSGPGSGPGAVFVAVVSGSEGYNAPEALPNGTFMVENGCLVFRYAGSRGLRRTPLLPPGSRLARDRDGKGTVVIGTASVALGEQVSVSGGDLPGSVVRTAIPGRCPQEVLLVTAVARS
jgi:hypothetical protein